MSPNAHQADGLTDPGGIAWSVADPEGEVLKIDRATATAITNAAGELALEYRGHEKGVASLDDQDLMVRCHIALRHASAELLRSLLSFRLAGSPDGTLLLRGLPMDDRLPATPSSGAFDGPWGELAVTTVGQLMLMSALGDVIAYADEKDGRLVQDICPMPGAETRQENTGSSLLELHTEDGFHPHKPDFISLLCLRADRECRALTVTGGVRRVLPLLGAAHARILREPLFRIKLASSFVGTDRRVYSAPMPVLSGSRTDPDLCVDFHAMEGTTKAAALTLNELRTHMLGSLAGMALKPGDMLVIDNRKAVHGRTPFSTHYDGEDRWLRRCFTVADIRSSHPQLYPESRVHRPLALDALMGTSMRTLRQEREQRAEGTYA